MSSATLTFEQLRPFMEADLKSNQTPALLGPPGIGKSSLVNDLARNLQTKVFTLQVNQLADRADLTGVRAVQDDVTKEWKQVMFPHATIADAIQYGKDHPNETPILFLDEFNRATSDITSAILSLQTERRIGHHYLPKNLLLVVAGNDKGNVTGVDQASTSRFSIYHVMPDLETYLAVNPKLNPFIREVLMQFPADLMAEDAEMSVAIAGNPNDPDDEDGNADIQLFALDDEESFKQITCPRTITSLSEWMNHLGLDKSGSQAEQQFLATQFANLGTSETVPFLAAIHAKVGMTTFAQNLYAKLHQYSNTLISSGITSSARLLDDIRPEQELINELVRASDVAAIERLSAQYQQQYGPQKLGEAIVWLLEQASVDEINNLQAVESFLNVSLENVQDLTPVMSNMMVIFGNPTKVSKATMRALSNSNAACLVAYKPFIAKALS